jgi:hypothetical protein
MSKGSNQRPTDQAAFGSNYERAFRGAPTPSSFGFVLTDPESFGQAAHRRPSAQEQHEINVYRSDYRRTFRAAPEGIHVLPGTRLSVFLPTE